MIILDKVFNTLRYYPRPQALVLMYHRIADSQNDPWDLAVSPSHFEQHLKVLSKYNIIPLQQLVLQHKRGKIKRNAISITFDDGYLDNYEIAMPMLEQYQMPATFFIPSKNIGTSNEYWWDELEQIIFNQSIIPRNAEFSVDDMNFILKAEEFNDRNKLYLRVWEQVFPLQYYKQQSILIELRKVLGVDHQTRPGYLCMNKDQMKKIGNSSLFDLHAHTVTHPALAYLSREKQEIELKQGWSDIKSVTGAATGFIAYPYGNFNGDTLSIAREIFEAGFTTEPNLINGRSDPHRLGRFQVKNWDGEKFDTILKRWLRG